MAKEKIAFVCGSCGYDSPKWIGKCPACGEWNTFVEQKLGKKSAVPMAERHVGTSPVSIASIKTEDECRIDMGDGELNRVLGGGLVAGSMVLLGGEPGIGKSTLILQTMLRLKGMKVLYVSGEDTLNEWFMDMFSCSPSVCRVKSGFRFRAMAHSHNHGIFCRFCYYVIFRKCICCIFAAAASHQHGSCHCSQQ